MYNRHHQEWQNGSSNHFRTPTVNYFNSGNNGSIRTNTNMSSEKELDNAPPIPQRSLPYTQSPYAQSPYYSPGYNGLYGNPFQSMFGTGMGGLYGTGNNMYGNTPNMGSFESASQNAFQTAQTFIGAFTSVSMMLESTLFAVQNSVRAITSVADQFGHLRNNVFQTSSTFLRVIKYYLNRILISLKLRTADQDEAKYWMEAMSGIDSNGVDSKRYASLLFFCVLVATPWFVWKFLKSLSSEHATDNSWVQGSGSHFVAEVKFPFTERNRDELSIQTNTVIRLAPKHLQPNVRGWLLAADGEKQGLVPANYIKILGKNRKSELARVKSENLTSQPALPETSVKTLDEIFEEEKEQDSSQHKQKEEDPE